MKPNSNRSMWVGGFGAGIAAMCCIAPVAIIMLGTAGGGAVVAWLDLIWFPALVFIAALSVAALIWNRRRNAARLSQNSKSNGLETS